MTAHKQVRSTEEALMLAIEALEDYGHAWPHHVVQYTNAITAIKAALEAHKALMSVSDGAQPAVSETHKRKPLPLPKGSCASEWGGRETGPCLYTNQQVLEILSAHGIVGETHE